MLKAKMSGANEFGTANDYCRHIAGYGKATCTLQDYVLEGNLSCLAEQEARAILAETEPSSPSAWTGSVATLNACDAAFPAFYAAERSALAESLAAFVA